MKCVATSWHMKKGIATMYNKIIRKYFPTPQPQWPKESALPWWPNESYIKLGLFLLL